MQDNRATTCTQAVWTTNITINMMLYNSTNSKCEVSCFKHHDAFDVMWATPEHSAVMCCHTFLEHSHDAQQVDASARKLLELHGRGHASSSNAYVSIPSYSVCTHAPLRINGWQNLKVKCKLKPATTLARLVRMFDQACFLELNFSWDLVFRCLMVWWHWK